jgi:flagella basal body P-ring formation protein FlgA
MGKPSPEEVVKSMLIAFSGTPVHIEVVEIGKRLLPPGRIVFEKSGLQSPPPGSDDSVVSWRGFVEYAPRRRMEIRARVRVRALRTRLVAVAPLVKGTQLGVEHVREERIESFPTTESDKVTLEGIEERVLLRDVAAGTVLASSDLAPARLVRRGDVVNLEVRSGSARVSLPAKAEGSGGRGARIPVRNLDSGRVMHAVVQAKGKARLDIDGGTNPSAGDMR